jgi:DNA-binding transcriptional MerR regulator
MEALTISQMARRSGVPASTLRYYEKIGVIPPAARSDSGYRRYDEAALVRLAFVQRAKALGVGLDDLADLVHLWDGQECAPVQERLRALVHQQRATTHERLAELTQLASDLDAVSASIGDAVCGPDCVCMQPAAVTHAESTHFERLIGAHCSFYDEEMRARLAEWRGLRDRAISIEPLPGACAWPSMPPSPSPRSPIWCRARPSAAPSTPSRCASMGRFASSTSAPAQAASPPSRHSSASSSEAEDRGPGGAGYRSRREPVCDHCGHGAGLHDGLADDQRPAGWCRACEDRRRGEELLPYCWWFSE